MPVVTRPWHFTAAVPGLFSKCGGEDDRGGRKRDAPGRRVPAPRPSMALPLGCTPRPSPADRGRSLEVGARPIRSQRAPRSPRRHPGPYLTKVGLGIPGGRSPTCARAPMDDQTRRRTQWIADHVLPLEPQLRGWLRHNFRTLSHQDIDDVIQDAYARLWRVELSLVRNVRAFLYAIVGNALRDEQRRRKVVQIEAVPDIGVWEVDASPTPEHWVSAHHQLERLVAFVKILPDQRLTVF